MLKYPIISKVIVNQTMLVKTSFKFNLILALLPQYAFYNNTFYLIHLINSIYILNIDTTSKSLSAHSLVLYVCSTTSSVRLTTSLDLVAIIVVPVAPSFVA
jgi:hypothetical protein